MLDNIYIFCDIMCDTLCIYNNTIYIKRRKNFVSEGVNIFFNIYVINMNNIVPYTIVSAMSLITLMCTQREIMFFIKVQELEPKLLVPDFLDMSHMPKNINNNGCSLKIYIDVSYINEINMNNITIYTVFSVMSWVTIMYITQNGALFNAHFVILYTK